VAAGVIDKSGSWYSYDGERIGQGRQNVIKFLDNNPDIFNSALIKVKEALGFSKNTHKEARDDSSPETPKA
jgi:recombination protein RecA